jgi:large subunit ribosomal protein L22
MKASLYNYRQSPRKVRVVANVVKGKKVSDALSQLSFLPKRAAAPLKKLILSAVSSAKELSNLEENNLFIKEFRIDKGVVLRRSTPRAFGRASRINKRSSHVLVVLDDVKNMKVKAKKARTAKVTK